jgi:hypothetical protein
MPGSYEGMKFEGLKKHIRNSWQHQSLLTV